jgi:hypothetical protein
MVGRGAAFADVDDDGDQDLFIVSSGGKPRLVRNDQQTGNHWLRFRLEGTRCNRDAIGAWIQVDVGGRSLRRQVMPTCSYLSQMELPVTFGLGPRARVKAVKIHWPDGTVQELDAIDVDQTITVRQDASSSPPQSATTT